LDIEQTYDWRRKLEGRELGSTTSARASLYWHRRTANNNPGITLIAEKRVVGSDYCQP